MLLGTIVEKDGCISLQMAKHPNVFYPLSGNSRLAVNFCESFNEPAKHDVGRKLHQVNGTLYLE